MTEFGLEVTGVKHPAVLVAGLLGLAVFVPYVARVVFPDSSFHPASFAIIAIGLVVVLARRAASLDELKTHWYVYAGGLLVAAVALTMTLLNRGDYGKAYVVNHMVVPLTLFAVVQVVLHQRDRSVRTLGQLVVIMGCIQTLIGGLQLATQSPLIFASRYGDYSWLDTMIAEGRVMGTMDHPLVLALFLLICVPLTFSFRSVYLRAGTVAVLLGGILLTQSRLAAVAGLAMVVILVFQYVSSRRVRLTIVSVLLLALGLVALSPLGQSLIGRFQNDQGSNTRRFVALDLYGSVWTKHILSGEGLGTSYALTGGAQLKSSLENPVLMMAVDIGLVWALIWVALQLWLASGLGSRQTSTTRLDGSRAVPRSGAWRSTLNLQFAAVAALLFTQSFSSTATESASSVLVWFALALFTVQRRNAGLAALEAGVEHGRARHRAVGSAQ